MIKFRPLKAEDVEVRVGKCTDKMVTLLLYKTARVDAALLDETVGPENWQNDYRSIDGKLFCGIGCRFKDGEWVWKWDTGVPSNMESQKGEASDAFKRAGFKWGIGTELYTAPEIKVYNDKCEIKQGKNGKPACYNKFAVTEMEVEDGQIVKLQICNMSDNGNIVYGNGVKTSKAQPTQNPVSIAKHRLWAAMEAYGKMKGRKTEDVLEDVKNRQEWESQKDSAEWLNAVASDYEELVNG